MWRIRAGWTLAGSSDTWLTTTSWADSIGLSVNSSVDALWHILDDCMNFVSEDVTYQIDPVVDIVDVATGHLTGTLTVESASNHGRSTTAQLPQATQGEISLVTGDYISGRQVVGKFYLPGLTTEASDDGSPSTGFKTALYNAIVANKDGTGILHDQASMKVYSRTHHSIHDIANPRPMQRFAVLRSRRQ